MVLDLVALAGIVVWAAVGWRRGVLSMGLGLLALACGYAAALALHRPAGRLLAEALPVSPLVAVALAGVGIFVVVAGTVRVAGRSAVRRRRERVKGGWEPPALDRLGGAAVGAVTAGAVVLLLAWAGSALASVLRPEPVAGPVDGNGAGPAPAVAGTAAEGAAGPAPVANAGAGVLERSLVGRLGTAAAERSVEVAARAAGADERTAAAAAVLVARPAEARAALRSLAAKEATRDILAADDLRRAFYAGDGDAVASDARVRRFFADAEVREALGTLRVVDVDGETPEEMATEVARILAPVGPAVERLRGDADFAAALERSRLRERLASGDVAGLAGDPDVVWMMGRVREVLAGITPPGG